MGDCCSLTAFVTFSPTAGQLRALSHQPWGAPEILAQWVPGDTRHLLGSTCHVRLVGDAPFLWVQADSPSARGSWWQRCISAPVLERTFSSQSRCVCPASQTQFLAGLGPCSLLHLAGCTSERAKSPCRISIPKRRGVHHLPTATLVTSAPGNSGVCQHLLGGLCPCREKGGVWMGSVRVKLGEGVLSRQGSLKTHFQLLVISWTLVCSVGSGVRPSHNWGSSVHSELLETRPRVRSRVLTLGLQVLPSFLK